MLAAAYARWCGAAQVLCLTHCHAIACSCLSLCLYFLFPQPMNAVLGLSRLLATTSLSLEQQQYVSMIENSGQLLLTIINDILDYSSVHSISNLQRRSNPRLATNDAFAHSCVYVLFIAAKLRPANCRSSSLRTTCLTWRRMRVCCVTAWRRRKDCHSAGMSIRNCRRDCLSTRHDCSRFLSIFSRTVRLTTNTLTACKCDQVTAH